YLVAYSQTAGGPLAPVRQKLDSLASVLATCVNSTGQTSTACTSLFEATHSAQNTLAAAFTVAKNPEANANALAIYNLIPGTPIFTPVLTTAPADTIQGFWTVGGIRYGFTANSGSSDVSTLKLGMTTGGVTQIDNTGKDGENVVNW